MSSLGSNDPFEIRLVAVRWAAKDQIRSVQTAAHPLQVERKADGADANGFTVDVPAYPQLAGGTPAQFGVWSRHDERPSLQTDGGSVELFPVKDMATGRTWWIEKGAWRRLNSDEGDPGYHDAPTCRHVGTVLMTVGSSTCRLDIASSSFLDTELKSILQDFRDQCWQLIVDSSSPAHVAHDQRSSVASSEFIQRAQRVVAAVRQVLEMPHGELREVLERQSRRRVRPVRQTFRELAVRGAPRHVTGRGHTRDLDVPENRYVAALVWRLLQVVHAQIRTGTARHRRIEQRVSEIDTQVHQMAEGVAVVHPDRLETFARVQEKQAEGWQKQIRAMLPLPEGRARAEGTESGTISLTVSTLLSKDTESLRLFANDVEGVEKQKDTTFDLFAFTCAETVLEGGLSLLDEGSRYEVDALFDLETKNSKRQRLGAYWTIYGVDDVRLIESKELREAKRLRKEAARMRQKGGGRQRVRLQRSWEQREQERERQSLITRRSFFSEQMAAWEQRVGALEDLKADLHQVHRRLEAAGVKSRPDTSYPGTMVFVQNPHYRAAHAAFEKIKASSGSDDRLFDRLHSLEDLGIIDLPMVYERWCLLELIRVFRQDYGYDIYQSTDDGIERYPEWATDLISTVTVGREKPFSILLQNKHSHRRIVKLTYQPHLENGKRPDFQLQIGGWEREDISLKTVRVILDAKCKSYGREAERRDIDALGEDMRKLVIEKDYEERERKEPNHVFILHPDEAAVAQPYTHQEWALASHYGGSPAFGWQQEFPMHRIGAVRVHPRSSDHLKRLVYQLLTYPVEKIQSTNKGEYRPQQKVFCPECGGTAFDVQKHRTKGGGQKYYYTCRDVMCEHFFVINYCQGCSYRLWKHGSHWTFHDTHPVSPYNVKCPSCGSYAIDDDE